MACERPRASLASRDLCSTARAFLWLWGRDRMRLCLAPFGSWAKNKAFKRQSVCLIPWILEIRARGTSWPAPRGGTGLGVGPFSRRGGIAVTAAEPAIAVSSFETGRLRYGKTFAGRRPLKKKNYYSAFLTAGMRVRREGDASPSGRASKAARFYALSRPRLTSREASKGLWIRRTITIDFQARTSHDAALAGNA